mmetsp:Transcript_23324/g.59675  ORF Transcript_23324/g.59675 Transcript_23324/m.59675 type:complete len:383 (-) Transcript_23324:379-1527(-)
MTIAGAALPVIALSLTVVLSLWTLQGVHQHQRHMRSSNLLKDIQAELAAPDPYEEADVLLAFGPGDGHELVHPRCHAEWNGDFDAPTVVKWGPDNLLDTAGMCCDQCSKTKGCNIWVWCAEPGGCGGGRAYRECWLKQAPSLKDIWAQQGYTSPNVGWVSGALYDDREMGEVKKAEAARLLKLEDDAELPLLELAVAIRGRDVGKVRVVLFPHTSPLAAENFRQLCTGERGVVPVGHEGAGSKYSLEGATFYRIIDKFINQAGINTDSVYGGTFKDDPGGLALKHDRKGVMSMANAGANTNTAHFSIVLAPAPHLDGHFVVFGEVVAGIEVMQKVNSLARGTPTHSAGPEEDARFTGCVQLRGPEPKTAAATSAGGATGQAA